MLYPNDPELVAWMREHLGVKIGDRLGIEAVGDVVSMYVNDGPRVELPQHLAARVIGEGLKVPVDPIGDNFDDFTRE